MSTGPLSHEDDLRVAEIAGIVLRNWRDELILLLREKLALLGGARRRQTILRVYPDVVQLAQMRGRDIEETAALARAGMADSVLGKDLGRIVRQYELGKDVFVVLPTDSILHPKLTMPLARRAALQSALRYEIERLSPVDPSELYYDFLRVDGDPDTGSAELELRIVRKTLVDEAVGLCHAADLAVGGLYFEGDARAADWQAFPIDRNALLRTLARRFGLAALGGLTVFLLVAVLLGAYLRGAAALDVLNDAVVDAGMQAAQVEQLQQTIARTTSDLSLATRQKQAPLFIATLAELTRTLPDGTWITELTMDGSKIRIQGASPSASDLIGLIDHSPRFANAQFEAPLVHDVSANVDRFDLSFDVRRTKS